MPAAVRIVPLFTVRAPAPLTPPPLFRTRPLTTVGSSRPVAAAVSLTLFRTGDPGVMPVAYSAAVSGRTPRTVSYVTRSVPAPVGEASP